MENQQSWDREAVVSITESLKGKPGALLPILHRIQHQFGYVPRESIAIIAATLNLSRAEVHGVVSFYHDFRSEPAGRNVIRVCRAESCQAMGAVKLAAHIRERLGIDFGETTGSGAFTLEPVYCLGNCTCSPAITINGEVHGRVTLERFDKLVADLAESGR
jgi:formate dehydrogenase subunit gamma